MTLATRQPMTDDGGLFTTGTVVNKAFIDQLYDQLDAQCHSTTNTTLAPKAITDEVVTARGSKASLDARLDVSINEDGTLKFDLATVTGGLRVGFAGTTSADRIDLGDAQFYLDFAIGGAGVPGIHWDGADLISFTRSTNLLSMVIGGANIFSMDASVVRVGVGSLAIGNATATAGDLRTNTAATIKARNNANSADLEMLALGSALDLLTLGSGATGVAAGSLFSLKKGADVASQAAMPTPVANVYHVTGVTNITSLTATNVTAGTVVILIFDGVLTFTDGSNLKLNGNFVTTADDVIALVYDGTNWYEIARSTN